MSLIDASLLEACVLGDEDGVASALASGANVNHRNGSGMSSLIIASGGAPPQSLFSKLLEAGADVNMCDSSGWTPLIYVCSTGQIPFLRLLLAQFPRPRLDSRTTDKGDWVPLNRAIYRGLEGVVGILLSEGADPSLTSNGLDALSLAQSLKDESEQHKAILSLLTDWHEKHTVSAEAACIAAVFCGTNSGSSTDANNCSDSSISGSNSSSASSSSSSSRSDVTKPFSSTGETAVESLGPSVGGAAASLI